MSSPERVSRVGFVLAKLRLGDSPHYFMRRNHKWNDVSFIGGHEAERDGAKLSRTAYRELMEEVPILRQGPSFELEPVTNEFCYGPVFSQSAKLLVGYELQFFLTIFSTAPTKMLGSLTSRSSNILLSEDELLNPQKYAVAGLVKVLDSVLDGGLAALPYSWPSDLSYAIADEKAAETAQIRLHLN
jgi:hypothetical protein